MPPSPTLTLLAGASAAALLALASCSAPDPGAYEIVPRRTASNPFPTGTTPVTPPPTDGGPSPTDAGDAGEGGAGSVVFDKPYAAGGAPDTTTIASKHPAGTNGPTTIASAKTTDCTSCHRMGGTAGGRTFVAGGVTKPNAEVGVKLEGGKVLTARATAEGYFYIRGSDSINRARTSVRDSPTNESLMAGPLGSGGCNQPACHGGSQGDVFKGK